MSSHTYPYRQPFSSHWTSDHVVYRTVFYASTSFPHASHPLTPHTDTCLFIFASCPHIRKDLDSRELSPTTVFFHSTILLSLYHYALFFMACSVRILWTVM